MRGFSLFCWGDDNFGFIVLQTPELGDPAPISSEGKFYFHKNKLLDTR